MPETADYIARFIEKALNTRLQADGALKKINPREGWLGCRFNPDLAPNDGDGATNDVFHILQRPSPAPYASYTGDPHDAFWYFDREMAELTEARYVATRGKQPVELHTPRPVVSADGQTVTVSPEEGVHVEVICGPLEKIDDTTFRLRPYECGSDNPKRSFSAWLVAIREGDATHKRAVQPMEVKLKQNK